ncbi:probable maleylacetoacetate isomerase 2 [Daphnia magna]|uniref:Glutathione S-transferase zeta n=3 Tax=Daphnia magna TaxID=35525 RepID=A0A162QN28_9CRUS|nr:probable maleylacetoacetate isomerase 2 [Daphnia magna]AOQ25846.1 glutathione S-transferase zeta [Daphnia magna]KAK4009914.1 hypothetical protein OUZ56_019057 [Daphnia magna]KZS19814.1 Maleylacetoacetate isomerase [Daphnia magna]
MSTVVLYSYFRSSCSWRVRIALELKEIDYEYKAVHLVKGGGQQNADDYKVLNPMAQVPSLTIGEKVFTQSIAIMEYLEESYPSKPLLPQDTFQRFKVREICEIIGSGIQPLQNLAVLKQFEESKQKDWASKWIVKGLIALEKVLEGTSGKYCVGDDITLADCCLVPQLYNARRFEVNVEQFPNVVRVEKNLEILEPFIKAHPNRQPDCPPELAA